MKQYIIKAESKATGKEVSQSPEMDLAQAHKLCDTWNSDNTPCKYYPIPV
jgi:hypothetical protein